MSYQDKSQQQNRPQPQPNGASPIADLKGIPVGAMQFASMVEIPGKLTSQGLKSEMKVTNRHRWRITYLPALRHHQLEFFPALKSEPECTYYIADCHVNWWSPL